ncbi:MAG: tRNA modification GTPase, partial [Flavobacteriales bacterium]
MRKNLLFILTVLFSGYSFSQISFEKGYYIDNSDNKVTCLIRNVDWKNNPTEFEYKLSDDSEIETLNISSAKEFGIDKDSRYVRAIVNIERSDPNFTSTLTESSQPQFNEEELFLKVLIQGKANLYTYSANNITKYFYNVDNSDIEQLIFIKYNASSNVIQTNQYYKQQLWLNLKCENILMNNVNRVDYKKTDLINFFTKYNECNQSEIVNYQAKQKRGEFNVTLRPRLNNSSLTIKQEHVYYNNPSSLNVDFDSKLNFGFGIESEFILPFNKNKWALLIEPTYNTFKNEKTYEIERNFLPNLLVTATIDYNSIELPFGVRHYLFLSDESKIFINLLFTVDF